MDERGVTPAVMEFAEAVALARFLRHAWIPYSEEFLPLHRLRDKADRMVDEARA